jgi:hypothetical protein
MKGLIFKDAISDAYIETQQRGYKATFGLNQYKTNLALTLNKILFQT